MSFLSATSLTFTPPSSSLAFKANTISKDNFPQQGSLTPTAIVISTTSSEPLLSDWVEQLELYIQNSLNNDSNADVIGDIIGYYLLPESSNLIQDIINQVIKYLVVNDNTTVIQLSFHTDDVDLKIDLIKKIRMYIQEFNETNPNPNYYVGVTAFVILFAILQSPILLIIPLINVIVVISVSFGLMYPFTFYKDIYGIAPAMMTASIGAMAIDYTVFILSRFSEEIANNKQYEKSVKIAFLTSGKIIMTSAIIILFCFLAICLFPVDIICYVGVSCVAAIFISMIVNMTLTPSLLLCFPFLFKNLGWIPFKEKYLNKFKSGYNKTLNIWHSFCELQSKPMMSIALLVIALSGMVPFIFGVMDFYYTLDTNQIFPRHTEFEDSLKILQKSFPPGMIYPQGLLIESSDGSLLPYDDKYYDFTVDFTNLLQNNLSHIYSKSSFICFNSALGEVLDPKSLRRFKRIDAYKDLTKMFISTDENTVKCYLIPAIDISINSTEIIHEMRSYLQKLETKYDYSILMQSIIVDGVDCVDYSMDRLNIIIGILTGIVIILTFLFFRYVSVPIRVVFTTGATFFSTLGMSSYLFCTSAFSWLNTMEEMNGLYWAAVLVIVPVVLGLSLDYDIGYLITSCGLLMICSFCGLFLSNVFILNTFAFILSFSVFVNTFIIRILVVPSILYLLNEMNWWPRKFQTIYVKYEDISKVENEVNISDEEEVDDKKPLLN
ncbi:hypothetical protein QTN25_005252 [Entamoeba marina]